MMSATDKQNSFANFSDYPLFRLAVCFALGILAGKYSQTEWKTPLLLSVIGGLLTASFIKRKFVVVFLSVAFIAAGAFCFQIKNQTISANRIKRIYDEGRVKSGEPVELEGIIRRQPEFAVGGFFIELTAEKLIYKGAEQNISGTARLFASFPNEQISGEYEQINLRYGSKLRVACNLRREDSFLNPGGISSKEIFDQQEIDATGLIKSPLLVEKIGETNTFAPVAWVYERRQDLVNDFL